MRQITLAISIFIFTIALVLLSSKYFVLDSYKNIEFNQNDDRVKGFIQSIKNSISYIESISSDYAEWDETYLFLQGKNTNYIYENFRDKTNTLQNLELDFLIYTKLNKEIFFEAYKNNKFLNDEFKKELLSLELQKDEASGFIKHNKNIFLFHRHPISTSDSLKKSNGYIYAGKVLTKEFLKKSNPDVEKITYLPPSIVINKFPKGNLHITSTLKIEQDKLKNTLSLINPSSKVVANILFEYSREIYNYGKKTTFIFVVIISLLLGFIITLFIMKQKYLKDENIKFEKLLKKKTSKLNETMHDLKAAIYQLEQIAYVDDLTGIHTRRSFFENIIQVLDEASLNNKEISFAMMDLDDFKIINDTYGHSAGDIVLQHFCRSCEKFLDESMILSRLGGEEFVIGFKDSSKAEALKICRDIQHFIDENPVTIDKTLTIGYTVSIGISNNLEHSNIDAILKEADEKLYHAKEGGKNLIRMRKT